MNKNAVTPEEVKNAISNIIVETRVEFGKPTTYVTALLHNGFTIRKSTTCVDPANYSEEIGKEVCMKKIVDEVWYLLGFMLQEDLYRAKKQEENKDEEA